MVKSDFEKLEEKFTKLENQVNAMGKVKPVKDKKPRAPSKYNTFVKKFIDTEKKKNPEKSHQELFSEAAKAWSAQKKDTE